MKERPQCVTEIRVADIPAGRTPRDQAIDPEHVELLRARLDSLPPIVVHAPEMTVIDGAHRLAAARLDSRETIAAVLFEGTEAQAFIEAVRRNVAHGKPLTLAERERAATEILRLAPTSSDRRVAEVCGLAADTVGRLRLMAGGVDATHRTGRDGRRRPTNPAGGRRRVAKLLASQRDISDRRAASAAGVSQGTVRDVRRRLARGESPLSERMQGRIAQPRTDQPEDWNSDNALRSDSAARDLAQWMEAHCLRSDEWRRWPGAIPLGRLYKVADEARRQAREWAAFADALEDRARKHRSG